MAKISHSKLDRVLSKLGVGAFFTEFKHEMQRHQCITSSTSHAGIRRESIYRALSEDGNPSFRNVEKLLKANGLRISIVPDENAPQVATKKKKATFFSI